MDGGPDTQKTTYIHERARIGDRTHAEHLTNIGVETHIGDDCEIGKSSVLEHETTVGDRTTLGEGTTMEIGSVVGDDVTTCKNAQINRGAEIGAGSRITGDAPIRAGAQVPPNTAMDLNKNGTRTTPADSRDAGLQAAERDSTPDVDPDRSAGDGPTPRTQEATAAARAENQAMRDRVEEVRPELRHAAEQHAETEADLAKHGMPKPGTDPPKPRTDPKYSSAEIHPDRGAGEGPGGTGPSRTPSKSDRSL